MIGAKGVIPPGARKKRAPRPRRVEAPKPAPTKVELRKQVEDLSVEQLRRELRELRQVIIEIGDAAEQHMKIKEE